MNPKKKRPAIVNLSILTLITTIVWVIFEVYRAITLNPDPVVPAEILSQISPELDIEALNQLQTRLILDENQIGDTVLISITEESQLTTPPQNINQQEATQSSATTQEETETTTQ